MPPGCDYHKAYLKDLRQTIDPKCNLFEGFSVSHTLSKTLLRTPFDKASLLFTLYSSTTKERQGSVL
jgi:hypothetical protein